MGVRFYVIAKTTHIEQSSKRGKLEVRFRYRMVKASAHHDKSLASYLSLIKEDGKDEIRVLNPQRFSDLDFNWVFAQLAVHEPLVSLGEYWASVVKSGKRERYMQSVDVAVMAITGKVYNWCGVEVYLDDEESGDVKW